MGEASCDPRVLPLCSALCKERRNSTAAALLISLELGFLGPRQLDGNEPIHAGLAFRRYFAVTHLYEIWEVCACVQGYVSLFAPI